MIEVDGLAANVLLFGDVNKFLTTLKADIEVKDRMIAESTTESTSWGVFGTLNYREYLAVAERRKRWIILTTVGMFCFVAVIVQHLPDIFRAETVVMVDPQQVPDKFVASTVSSNIADRLSTIKEQVLSPTRLGRLIETMNLYPELKKTSSEQDLIAIMQKAINVEVISSGGSRLSAFKISYRGKEPGEAAKVTNQIADMFIQENLKAREKESMGTVDFLEGELQNTKRQLDEKDAQLQALRNRYVLDLPESKQYHLEALSNLRSQLQASQDRVRADQQQKVLLQSMEASVTSAPTVDLDSGMDEDGAPVSPEKLQLQKQQAALSALRARYGPNFPDVRKAQTEVDKLQAKIAAEEKRGADQPAIAQAMPRHASNPVVDGQISKLDEEIQEQLKLQPQLQEQINLHVSKLEQVPVFEQQISGLMRDDDSLRAQYTSLLDRKLAAQMSNALEVRQKGERFVVLDPAVPPAAPYAPNRLLIMLAGLVAGLGGGIGLAILAEMQDESVRTETEAARILGTPVLTGIPLVVSPQERRRRFVSGSLSLAGMAVGSCALGLLTFHFLGFLH
jgi:succinoglycan biosynthesis transport protein ExoP